MTFLNKKQVTQQNL